MFEFIIGAVIGYLACKYCGDKIENFFKNLFKKEV